MEVEIEKSVLEIIFELSSKYANVIVFKHIASEDITVVTVIAVNGDIAVETETFANEFEFKKFYLDIL